MSIHTRAALAKLPVYRPGKSVPNAVKLSSNEMHYPPLPAVVEAITATASLGVEGINRYPDNAAITVTDALAAHVSTGGNTVTADNIAVGCGSVALCQQIIQATCDDGDEVLFGWRSFEAYPIVTQVVGAVPVTVPVTDTHELDLSALAAAVTDRTRVIFVCTPNNPTGTVVDATAIDEFIAAVPSSVLIVLDEAYTEFVTDPTIPDGIALALAHTNVVSLRTLSKAYGLAGLRVGYVVGAAETVNAFKAVGLPFAVNSIAQAAAVAALDPANAAELRRRCDEVIAERERVTAALREAGFEVPTSHGNFVWLPLREKSAAFAEHCMAAGVIVRPFNDATGGVRVTISTADENDVFLSAARSFPQ